MVHTKTETLGDVIKDARQRSGLTIEELANRLDISERYLYRIENEGKKTDYLPQKKPLFRWRYPAYMRLYVSLYNSRH